MQKNRGKGKDKEKILMKERSKEERRGGKERRREWKKEERRKEEKEEKLKEGREMEKEEEKDIVFLVTMNFKKHKRFLCAITFKIQVFKIIRHVY